MLLEMTEEVFINMHCETQLYIVDDPIYHTCHGRVCRIKGDIDNGNKCIEYVGQDGYLWAGPVRPGSLKEYNP